MKEETEKLNAFINAPLNDPVKNWLILSKNISPVLIYLVSNQ